MHWLCMNSTRMVLSESPSLAISIILISTWDRSKQCNFLLLPWTFILCNIKFHINTDTLLLDWDVFLNLQLYLVFTLCQYLNKRSAKGVATALSAYGCLSYKLQIFIRTRSWYTLKNQYKQHGEFINRTCSSTCKWFVKDFSPMNVFFVISYMQLHMQLFQCNLINFVCMKQEYKNILQQQLQTKCFLSYYIIVH